MVTPSFEAILSYNDSILDEENLINTNCIKKRRPRLVSPDSDEKRPYRRDYMACQWWNEFIDNPSVHSPQSHAGKLFRRRFRVPFEIYE